MEIEQLLTLIKTMSDSELTELKYEENSVKIRLRKAKEQPQLVLAEGDYAKMQLAGNSAAAVRIMSASHTLYFAFYLLYLTLTYLPVLLVCYRIYWNRGQREYEHLKKVYAEHEADAAARDAMPEVELKVIPEHKSKVFAAYNSFRGKRPKK